RACTNAHLCSSRCSKSPPAPSFQAAALRGTASMRSRTRLATGSPECSWIRSLVDNLKYIVVEGPIGVGKTSLAKKLARRLAAETLLEEPMANPFLARFYEDMARFALPT